MLIALAIYVPVQIFVLIVDPVKAGIRAANRQIARQEKRKKNETKILFKEVF